jgi:hypothetical protein
MRSLDRHGVSERFVAGDARSPVGSTASRLHLSDLNLSTTRSTTMYAMYEALARERLREQREQSARWRLSHDLAAARRWRRLAAYSAGRAARSRRQLAEHSAADYQLVG